MEKREAEIILSLMEAIKALEQQLANAMQKIAELEAKYESN
jgi:hypothetical protein